MKRTSIARGLLLGLLIGSVATLLAVSVLAEETRAIKPVRIEAKTAQNETVSYIYAESHALVIGVSQYRNGWSNLPGVQEDVEELSSALADNGFAVTVVEDPTLEEMEIAIEDFIFEKGANPDNRLLIYYAGHGHTMTLGYGGEMGYLVPADAPLPKKGRNTAFQRSVMSMQQVEVFAKNTSAKHVLFMFDACFAGSVFLATRAAPAYIQVYTKEPVRQFITSGSAEQEVPDKSIFRRAFVDALNGKADYDKDGYLTGSELGSYIQKRTAEDWKGNLTPQYGKLQDPNLNKGDFVFELSKPEVVKPPPAEPAPVVPPEPQQDYANLAWQLIKDLEDPKAFEEFIKMFPEAPQSNLAKLKLIALASSAPQKAEESMSPPVVTETLSPPVVTDNVVFEKQASTSKETPASSTPPPKTESTAQWSDWAKKPSPPTSATTNNALAGEAAKKRLLEVGNCVECDLTKANLEYAKLNGADLNGANLRGANLRGANLVKANLVKANLEYTLLLYAYLNGANLRGANLRGANLKNAILFEANLENANLENANLNAAKFCNTIMSDGSINNSNCDSNSSKESSSFLEKADPQITGRGMDYSAYQAVEQDSSDVVGCGFFHVGCEEKALTFPAYQPDFHLKGYRRVNLWGKDRPWTDTELQVKSGDVVVFYGKGDVKGIRHNQLRLGILVGNSDTPIVTDKSRKIRYNTEARTISQQIWFYGNLKLAIPDWNTYPPPSQNYDDNSGVLIIDIFVIDPDQEEGFNRFKDALFEANPNDSNAKAYLGR